VSWEDESRFFEGEPSKPTSRFAQRYSSPIAQARMANGLCPECGEKPDDHGGRGGPGCSLRDDGVAHRIQQYREDLAAETALEG
jgi:hypothetical protein